jgi:hypothetical protein
MVKREHPLTIIRRYLELVCPSYAFFFIENREGDHWFSYLEFWALGLYPLTDLKETRVRNQ